MYMYMYMYIYYIDESSLQRFFFLFPEELCAALLCLVRISALIMSNGVFNPPCGRVSVGSDVRRCVYMFFIDESSKISAVLSMTSRILSATLSIMGTFGEWRLYQSG